MMYSIPRRSNFIFLSVTYLAISGILPTVDYYSNYYPEEKEIEVELGNLNFTLDSIINDIGDLDAEITRFNNLSNGYRHKLDTMLKNPKVLKPIINEALRAELAWIKEELNSIKKQNNFIKS